MRIEACEHGARMKVWLCVGTAMVGRVMDAVMRSLPGAMTVALLWRSLSPDVFNH
ncbi:MAG TPA: hypothetical protein VF670_19535 [Duganella sp.]|jgi:hypothetical protein